MTPFKPKLRPEIAVTFDAGGARVDDPVLDRHVDLGPVGAELLRRLDGTRTVAEATATLPDQGARLLRRLFLLNLIDGAGAAAVDRVRRLKRGEDELGYALLGEARFACQGSGECCQNYVFGPLEAADVARLDALEPELRRAFPDAGLEPFVAERALADGTRQRYLRSVADRCVFLQEDRRCGIHARFGADAKPKLCRLYPIETMATIEGVKIYDKGSCATFAVSARAANALPLVDDLERIRPLLPASHELVHPVVRVGDVLFDYGHFLRFVRAGIELTRRPLRAPIVLRALGRALRDLRAALESCAIDEGEPDASVAAALAAERVPAWLDAPGDPRGADVIADIASDLIAAVGRTIMSANSDGRGWFSARLLREAAQLLHVLQAPDGAYFEELARAPADDPEIHEVLRLSIRQQLYGHGALIADRAHSALLRMAIVQLVALAGARMRAAEEQRAVVAADLSHGHMLATRLCSSSTAEAVLLSYEEHAGAVLESLS